MRIVCKVLHLNKITTPPPPSSLPILLEIGQNFPDGEDFSMLESFSQIPNYLPYSSGECRGPSFGISNKFPTPKDTSTYITKKFRCSPSPVIAIPE